MATAEHTATFRFYGELDVFLPSEARGQELSFPFRGRPSVKDAIEAQGVPHPETAYLLANGEPVGFDYSLREGDRIAVFPAFRALPRPPTPLPGDPNAFTFVLDVNLGKLARWLRLLGFDSLYRNDYTDHQVANLSAAEDRIALTRDRRLLYQKRIVHGYWVRSDQPSEQILEIVQRFHLQSRIRPLSRCAVCNGEVEPVRKEKVRDLLEPKTRRYYHSFFQCAQCRNVYWRGSHYQGVLRKLEQAGVDPGPL